MQGTFLRSLFTLQARTRNPFYLVLMVVFGVIPFVALAVLIVVEPLLLSVRLLLVVLALLPGGVALNFLFSILEMTGSLAPRKGIEPLRQNARVGRRKRPGGSKGRK